MSDASPEPTAPTRVRAAKLSRLDAVANSAPGTRHSVEGFLFYFPNRGEYLLASSMCESYPPKPCDTVVALSGVDAKQAAPHLDGKPSDPNFAHTEWSNHKIRVTGLAGNSGLTVETID